VSTELRDADELAVDLGKWLHKYDPDHVGTLAESLGVARVFVHAIRSGGSWVCAKLPDAIDFYAEPDDCESPSDGWDTHGGIFGPCYVESVGEVGFHHDGYPVEPISADHARSLAAALLAAADASEVAS